MTEQQKPAASLSETDNEMIKVLRACGFHVRTNGLLDQQRPQVFGPLDAAISLFNLTVAGADVGGVDACGFAPYLKEGETPLQRLQREIADSETLASMLAEERAKVATLQADATAAKRYGYLRNTPGMLPLDVWEALEGTGAVVDGIFDQEQYGADLDRAIDAASVSLAQKAAGVA